ncbi:hypothetical protein KC315_g17319, partial [Hortaea werneckii]
MKALLRTVTSRPAIHSHIRQTNHLRIVRSGYATATTTMEHSVPPLNDKSLLKNQSYINGQWVGAKSGQTFEVTDPASGKPIGTTPEMNRDDTTAAIDA